MEIRKVPAVMVEGLQEMIDAAGAMVKREDILAYEGQTVFHLEKGEYVPNQNRIKVFVGGVPQYSPENFLESSPTTITFYDGLPDLTVVHVEYLVGIAPIIGDLEGAFETHVDPDNESAHTIDNIIGLREKIGTKYIPGDWNNAVETGLYTNDDGNELNSPGGDNWYVGIVIRYDANWIVQIVFDGEDGTNPRYVRTRKNGVWGQWKGPKSALEDVTNIRLNRNKLSWVNPTSSNFLGVYVFGSDQDISTWDINQCANYATQLTEGNVTEVIMSPYPHTRLYFKIFCEYEISDLPVFSSGATASSVSTSTFYYEEGDEYNLITGGWGPGYVTGIVSTIKNPDHLYMSAPGNGAFASFISSNKINLTNVKRLALDWVRSAAGTGAAMQVASLVNGDSTDFVASLPAPTTRGVTYLDVSAVTGTYHIRVAAASGATLQVYKVWGEY